MLINLDNLLHLPVETEDGVKLGKVYDFNIDIDDHNIMSYAVRNHLLGQSHLIKPVQIVGITAQKIIVESTYLKEEKKEDVKRDKSGAMAGIAMSVEK